MEPNNLTEQNPVNPQAPAQQQPAQPKPQANPAAAMPNAATLMSEYAPERRRALLVNLMFVGFPMGSSLGGFLSAWMIPHYGWQSVLVLGGVMPLLLAVALIFLLPESARYLVVKQQPAKRIAAILIRIAPLPEVHPVHSQNKVPSTQESVVRQKLTIAW